MQPRLAPFVEPRCIDSGLILAPSKSDEPPMSTILHPYHTIIWNPSNISFVNSNGSKFYSNKHQIRDKRA